jgi:surface protein
MAVKKTKVVVKVELPVGKLGLTVVKSPPEVGAVRTGSPVVGRVAPGDIIVSLTRPGLGDVDTTSMDGQAVMGTLIAFAEREGRSLTVAKHGIYGVGVPPGPLGVSFVDGTCTVHVVKPTSPLLGATIEGDTLLSVNGKPVTPTTIFDVIKAADDGTSERKIVFRGTGCEIVEGVVVAEGPALTNQTLRDWVGRWCGGACRDSKYRSSRFTRDREGLPPISKWNTSRVTDMSHLFSGKSKFNDDISAWDTSNVTNMFGMFSGAKSFNQPLNDWRVDNVTHMGFMFYGASSFNQPLSEWRVDKVTDMRAMFCGDMGFSGIGKRSSFNQPLNDWRVDNVTNMGGMFQWATAFNQPLDKWQVNNVRTMREMFCYATKFNQPLGNWQLRPDCNVCEMFGGGHATDFRKSRPEGGQGCTCAIS